MSHSAVIALGSNIDAEANLPRALDLLRARLSVRSVSSVYESVPVGSRPQPRFLNAAALAHCEEAPSELYRQILRPIERDLGRQRTGDRCAPRTIDLDLVLFDDLVGSVDDRPIPDPELLERAHVAVPVAEILPGRRHPRTGEALSTIATRLRRALEPHALELRDDLKLGT